MSKFTLIRHGQASFGAENYDQLSNIGREQARAIGDYFLSQQTEFDQIVHGALSRQMETAQLMAKHMKHVTPLVLDERANEFDSERLLQRYIPKVAELSAENQTLINSTTKPWYTDPNHFERIFRKAVQLWQQDSQCDFESWDEFKRRINELLHDTRNNLGPNKRIAIVTSGGLIAHTLQSVLGCDDQVFLDMNLSINNASLSEFKVSETNKEPKDKPASNSDKINAKLLCFNNVSPLLLKRQKHLITRK
jgi:broad specificity phosphatase PhoE